MINIKHKKPIFVCSIYRPPSATAQWHALFAMQLDKVTNLENEIFILDYFNINLLACNCTTNKLSQTTELYDLKQWNCMTLNNELYDLQQWNCMTLNNGTVWP